MPMWEFSDDMRELARRVIDSRGEVAHVELDQVLFLKEYDTTPKALARCHRFGASHPMRAFLEDKPYCIIFFMANCGYMSEKQLALLMLHELMHIPARGHSLVDHDVQDFRAMLDMGLDWAQPEVDVPDILEDLDEDLADE